MGREKVSREKTNTLSTDPIRLSKFDFRFRCMVSCENNKMLRFPLRHKPRKFKKSFGPGSGPAEREKRLQMIVTSLIRHERIEGNEGRLDETRQYAEEVSYVFATIYYADLRNYGY